MRKRQCLLLLPALHHPSAEISLNLRGKITSIINHFSTDDVGAGWKASHFYQRWNSTLPNTRSLPGVPPLSSQTKLIEMKLSIPLWQEDATGVWWASTIQDPTAFYCFALSAAALYPFSSLFWNNGFLISQATKQENQFWELLPLCKIKFMQKPKKQRDVSPNFHMCPWPWTAGTWISCLAPGPQATLNDQEKNTRALNLVNSQP